MTPQQPSVQRRDRAEAFDAPMPAADGQRKLQRDLGGGDLRDRKSTTLVVAWMSPPFFVSVGAFKGLNERLDAGESRGELGWDALSQMGGGG